MLKELNFDQALEYMFEFLPVDNVVNILYLWQYQSLGI